MTQTLFRDKSKCTGCCACIVACKVKHSSSPHPISPPEAQPQGINLIRLCQAGPYREADRIVEFFQPISCMHCEDAPCIEFCPRGALHRDPETSLTLVDKARCTGCRFCEWICPYGVPRFDDGKVRLCDLCLDRLRLGLKPACQVVCQARAIVTGTPDEITAYQKAAP